MKDAISAYKKALSGWEKEVGPDDLRTLEAQGKLGSAYHAQGKMAAAVYAYEQARSGYQRALGPDHPDTLSTSLRLALAAPDRPLTAPTGPLAAPTGPQAAPTAPLARRPFVTDRPPFLLQSFAKQPAIRKSDVAAVSYPPVSAMATLSKGLENPAPG
ncbi:MAG TPA: tetratricopeptide repeat protein [Streptosporangiaceae bacterium]|nr:tetratricopeptide repeat protein [Streptosporangiaceae bacterium]